MKTEFSPVQLQDPDTQVSSAAIRKCVHCGFCTATCPTYVLLGDELDSPRGRIYLIKNMLEEGRAPGKEEVKHIDRCLSCLACTTTCPSGVDYMHLIDHARHYVQDHYQRPLPERLFRRLLSGLLPSRARFRLALQVAQWTRPLARRFAAICRLRSLQAMVELAPEAVPAHRSVVAANVQPERGRVILLQGCAEPVLKPAYRASAEQLLNQMGYSVVVPDSEGCCGALNHHLGFTGKSLAAARRNIEVWERVIEQGSVDAILTTASGCGTTLKDYGHMLREDPVFAERAARISSLVRDVSEFLQLPADKKTPQDVVVAYHGACSLQHGQQVKDAPVTLLREAGFTVVQPADSHLCCGSAGTYNILQPEIAAALGDRKVASLDVLKADVIATGNIGCVMQIAARTKLPVVHTVELLAWASGGERPF